MELKLETTVRFEQELTSMIEAIRKHSILPMTGILRLEQGLASLRAYNRTRSGGKQYEHTNETKASIAASTRKHRATTKRA